MNPQILSIIYGLISNGLPKVADAVVDKGIDYVQSKLGVELKPESQMSPADYEAIQKEANKHEEFMFVEELKDRQDARDMLEKTIQSEDSVVKHFIFYFAWFWSVTAVAYFFSVTFVDLPEKTAHFADIILGFLMGTAVGGILQFFYGSSKSSMDKTAAMMRGSQ